MLPALSMPAAARAARPARALPLGLAWGLVQCLAAGAVAAAPPQRIVTLAPSLTEAVCALERCAALVGVDRHSDWPAEAASLPRVGGLEEAHLEQLVALRPDLVLLGPRSRVADRLQALGVPVLLIDARTHADLRRSLLRLGEALGRPAQAQALVQRIDSGLAAAAARVPPPWRGRRVYLEVAPGVAAGAGSFIGETLARLGLHNIAAAEPGLFPRLNPEQVLRERPELLIGQRSALAEAAQRPGWAGMGALRDGRLCLLDERRMDLLSRPGPRLAEAAHMLVDCLLALPNPN
ncbi:ABC transporter substrate-binding protein [Aquabacterium sp. OR-4]|uniref:ABC transporter substrate-binding protein n=1 Tax=Aquabacterium sp. OR-4 TaxID=2978127 RepID=UPI0028C5B941|nr:helical backbone metal receptor [Aquabacterium sp. OR-4]MDT7836125.1 helical backbone metal receptor [Aquabacterium sp. OR-4]